MITLAVRTGIPMSEWLEWGDRAVQTAFDVLAADAGGPDDLPMSG